MKIKKIYCAKYDGPWSESALDYEKELKHFRKNPFCKGKSEKEIDDLYMVFRNAAGSVNSYKIEETTIPNPEVCEFESKFQTLESWDAQIHAAAQLFYDKFEIVPTIMNAHPSTIEALSKKMMSEFPKDVFVDMSELYHSECPEFDVVFVADDTLPEGSFRLVHKYEVIENMTEILYHRSFSLQEATLIKKGYVNKDDDRWKMNWDKNELSFIRTWTNTCIFKVLFLENSNGL